MRERTRTLVVTSAALFLTGLVWYSYSALLPLVAADWSMSGPAAGAVFAAFQLGYVLSILPAGVLADRHSTRHVIAVGCAGTGLATLAFALAADGFLAGAALRLIAGASMAGVYVPGMRFLAEWYPGERRGTAIGLYVGAFSLSSGASFFLASALASALGWRAAIALTALGAVVSGPLVVGLTRDRPGSATSSGGGGLDLSLLRDRSYLYVVGIYSGHNWELFGARNWIQAFLVAAPAVAAAAHPTVLAGTLAGVAVAVGAVANPLAGWVSDRIGRAATLGIVLATSAALSLSIGALSGLSLLALAPLVVVYGLALTADSAPTSTAVTEVAPDDRMGAALALQSFVGFGVSVVSPVVFGVVLDRAGFAWAFPTLAVGPLLGLVALWLLVRRSTRKDPPDDGPQSPA